MNVQLVLILLFFSLLTVGSVYIIHSINTSDIISLDEKKLIDSSFATVESANRRKCDSEISYCFTDNDCRLSCAQTSKYSCTKGICTNTRVVETLPENKCNAQKGFLAYLVGNVAFGFYEYICKSIDPGIALSVDANNLMCLNQDPALDIDYLKQFPSAYSCSCSSACPIPATSVKRFHIECNDNFADLFKASYSELYYNL